MSKIENFQPKPTEGTAAAQSIQKDAYAEAPVRGQTVKELPPEFPNFSIEHHAQPDGSQTTLISTGLASNDVRLQGQDDPAREFYAHPIPNLELPSGLAAAEIELKEGKGSNLDQIGLGVQVGVVKGVYGLGNGLIELGNLAISPEMRFGNFLANAIKNPELANHDAENFGVESANNIFNGMKAVLTADKYLEDVSNAEWKGDFGKVPRDIANYFDKLNPGQRAEFAAEQTVTWGVPGAVGKVSEGTNVVSQMRAKMAGLDGKAAEAANQIAVVPVIDEAGEVAFAERTHAMTLSDEEAANAAKLRTREHLDGSEVLKGYSEKVPVEIKHLGGSAEFAKKVEGFVEALDPQEKIFLSEHNIKIAVVNMVRDAKPMEGAAVGGLWVPAENTIYIPQKVFERMADNPAVAFHLRHELGHAFNDMKFGNYCSKIDGPFSSLKDFREKYVNAFDKMTEDEKRTMRLTRDMDDYKARLEEEKRLDALNPNRTDKISWYNPSTSRHEVFADLYAHATGEPLKNRVSELMEKHFSHDCEEYVREKVSEYISTVTQRLAKEKKL
jgi:hypothetical protein